MEEKEDLTEYARRESDEFRRLEKEHRELDQQIAAKYGDRKYLSPEDEIGKKNLQKQKLAKKDRMFQLLKELEATVK
jgi:uncharacterized protein YdcH (DUF465 family)